MLSKGRHDVVDWNEDFRYDEMGPNSEALCRWPQLFDFKGAASIWKALKRQICQGSGKPFYCTGSPWFALFLFACAFDELYEQRAERSAQFPCFDAEIINASHSMRMAGEYDDDIMRIRGEDQRKREVQTPLMVVWSFFVSGVKQIRSSDGSRWFLYVLINGRDRAFLKMWLLKKFWPHRLD